MAIGTTLEETGYTVGYIVLKIRFYAEFSSETQLFVTRRVIIIFTSSVALHNSLNICTFFLRHVHMGRICH
jgi:hypothetical protein